EVGEEVVAQVVLDVAPDVEDDEARERADDRLDAGDRHDQPEVAEEPPGRRAGRDRIDGVSEQPRKRHGEAGRAEETGEPADVPEFVAGELAPRAGHSSASHTWRLISPPPTPGGSYLRLPHLEAHHGNVATAGEVKQRRRASVRDAPHGEQRHA